MKIIVADEAWLDKIHSRVRMLTIGKGYGMPFDGLTERCEGIVQQFGEYRLLRPNGPLFFWNSCQRLAYVNFIGIDQPSRFIYIRKTPGLGREAGPQTSR